MKKENSNLAEEIKNIVENSIQQMDFKDLNQKINSTVNSAMDEAKKAIKTSGVQLKKEMESRGVIKPKKQEIRIPYKQKGKVSGIVSSIFGGIGLFVFGISMLVFLILSLALPYVSVFPILLACFSPLAIGSGVLFGKGISLQNLAKRSERYFFFLKEKGYCSVDSIASRMGLPVKKVRTDIKKMLGKGIFPQGALDEQETCFIGNNEYYDQYQQALESYKERIATEEQPKIEASIEADYKDEYTTQVERTLLDGRTYLEEIKKIQNTIYEPEFSDKLQRLRTIVEQIFEHVQKHPNQIDEIRRFMEYYLPTTLKLVKAYENFSLQPIQGDNITQSKKEIKDTIGTINKAFEQLLDSLYEDVTMDVSTDISVLQTMLKQEGLTESDFSNR